MECRVLKEEIFGPILPIISYRDDDEAISICGKMPATPLTFYVFTKSQKRYEKFMARIPSGSAIRNDTLLQLFIPEFPFGGIGTSGIGSYHGKASFTAFTHRKTSQYHPCHAALDFCGLR
jgi:aldehyde dehydrogenase (NAD+)